MNSIIVDLINRMTDDDTVCDIIKVLSGFILLFNGQNDEKLALMFDLLLEKQIYENQQTEQNEINKINEEEREIQAGLKKESVLYYVYNVFSFFLKNTTEVIYKK